MREIELGADGLPTEQGSTDIKRRFHLFYAMYGIDAKLPTALQELADRWAAEYEEVRQEIESWAAGCERAIEEIEEDRATRG